MEGRARQILLEKIKDLNKKRNYKIGTGFLTTPLVFEMLSEAGDSDGAYRTLINPDFGWGQQLRQGATTIWENWTPDGSLNHYSKGACCQWLFDCVCGIRLDGRENHFVIAPHLIRDLENIRFVYDSVYGKVESAWEWQAGKALFHIMIPPNCSASLRLPDGTAIEYEAGSHEIACEI